MNSHDQRRGWSRQKPHNFGGKQRHPSLFFVGNLCSPADNAIELAGADEDPDPSSCLINGPNKVCNLESARALAPDSTVNHTALLIVDKDCAACTIVIISIIIIIINAQGVRIHHAIMHTFPYGFFERILT